MDKNINLLLASYSNKVRKCAREAGIPPNSDAENLILSIAINAVIEQYQELAPFLKKVGM